MKKLILLLLLTNCNIPTVECQPNLPCTADQLKYVKYEPPTTIYNPVYPSQPIISIQSGNGQLTVSWSSCANANSYNVYISTDGINYIVFSNVTSPYTLNGLTNDIKYHVMASSVNVDGETMSLDSIAIPGIIDNLDGSITVINMGLTWSKCSQKDVAPIIINGVTLRNDTYNPLNNDCSNGLPVKLVYCMTRFGCDDGTILTGVGLSGTGVSEVYNSCAGRGIGWRVPSADELLALNYYYSSTYWPDIVNDMYYPNNGWGYPQPYGGYVWVNIIGGYFNSANFADPSIMPGYVLCVK